MTFELIDIALAERQPHPRLPHRVTGKVRAVLAESIDGGQLRHDLVVPVWIDTQPGMDEGDIDLALMVKAAEIVRRLRQRLVPPAS